jgi:hypothetical protein
MKTWKENFGLALCKILDFVELTGAQDFLLNMYLDFFEVFKPTEQFEG